MKVLILLICCCLEAVRLMPISVPVDNQYPDVQDRRPNAYYNRLPNKYSNDASVADDYDDDDDDDYQQTDRPVPSSQYSPASSQYYGQILTENKIKRKKRRKKRPCIPIQSFGSPLFNNRLKREIEGTESGKTLGLFNLLSGYGSPYYGFPPQNFPGAFPGGGGNFGGFPGGGGNRPFFDNVKPQSDTGVSSSNFGSFGQPQYNPIGGYPCVPVSYGHVPHGGPFGFFGQGGLLDFGSGGIGGGGQSPSFGYPQTVIINRPPLFGSRPPFSSNRPGGVSSSNGVGGESDQGTGFLDTVVNKLQEFVTTVNPQQVFTAIGDTLQGLGTAIQNTQPASSIRQGYDEFRSLLFR